MNDYPRQIRYPDQVRSPAPTVLEDHPYIRITRCQGFVERDFDPAKRVLVPLTQTEIRVLAQHHLDAVYKGLGFIKWDGSFGDADRDSDAYYRGRYRELVDLLSKEDLEMFREINRIRKMYIDSFRAPETKPT